eukprot:s1191_g22.t1
MATVAAAAFTTQSFSCEAHLLQHLKVFEGSLTAIGPSAPLEHFLKLLDSCIESRKDQDDRSEGGWRPEVDRIFKATGRTAPELAFLAALHAERLGATSLESTPLLQHVKQQTIRRVLYTSLDSYDRKIFEAQNLSVETLGEGCGHDASVADLWLRPKVECLVSLCKAGSLKPFVTMDLRPRRSLQQLVILLKDCGYQHFKVSRLFIAGVGTEVVGPLGDKASDWRLGLAWRNASSVLGDSVAVQRAAVPLVLHAARVSRKNLALCLSGQPRGRNSVADLQWVQRFGSFDIFAVVPLEDCQRARQLLQELDAEVLCVDSLFMNPEELRWIFTGPKADPDICPGHHCVYVWRDVESCRRLVHRHMAR